MGQIAAGAALVKGGAAGRKDYQDFVELRQTILDSIDDFVGIQDFLSDNLGFMQQ